MTKNSRHNSDRNPSGFLRSRLVAIIIAALGIIAVIGAQVFENHSLSENITHHNLVIFTASGGKWAGLALVGFGMLVAALAEAVLHGRWRILAIVPLILAFVSLYPLNQRFADEDNTRILRSGYERCPVKDITYRDRRGHLQSRFAWVIVGNC